MKTDATTKAEGLAQADAVRGEEFRVDGRQARRLLDAAELRRLTTLDDRRALAAPLKTLSAIAGLLLLGVWAFGLASAGGHGALLGAAVLVPCVILMGFQQQALFVLAHEAAHYRLFSQRRWNDGVGRLVGTLGGISMCTYRVTHRLHHNHLYGPQDPDLALNAGYPRGKAYLMRKLLIDLTGWTAPKTYAYFFGAPAINSESGGRVNPLNDTSEALRCDARRDRWWVVAFHVAMPLLCWLLGGARALALYGLLWILPLVTVMQFVLRLRAITEHGAPAGYDSPLKASRTNLPGRGWFGVLLHRLFFPHHVNYHIEHHLYPAIPHYHLPAAHAALAAKGAFDGAEVRPFTDAIRRGFQPKGSIPEAIAPRRARTSATAGVVPQEG